jgi:hypothetical protein
MAVEPNKEKIMHLYSPRTALLSSSTEYYIVKTLQFREACVYRILPDATGRIRCRSRSYFTTDGQSVSLGVKPTLGLVTRYYFRSESCCLKVADLFLWGALSYERTDLQFAVQNLMVRVA